MTAVDAGFLTDQDYFGALGAQVVQERARSVGATALPRPVTEIDDDGWFLYQPFSAFMEASAGVDFKTSDVWMFDSKAQRKVVDGEAIVFQLQNTGSDSVQLRLLVRVLCKLH